MKRTAQYRPDLAWIHHDGFGNFARSAGRALLPGLSRLAATHGTLVDLGCGSGIWAAMASRAGLRVVAVDRSAAMIALARRVAPRARFVRAELEAFVIPPCDAVTALGEVFNYHTGRDRFRLRRLLGGIARALRPGGRLIFDVVLYEGKPMAYRTWQASRDWAVLAEIRENRSRRTLHRRIVTFRRVAGRIRRSEECHSITCFRREEVESALREAGFRFQVRRRYGRTPLAPRRAVFLATRPG